MTNIVIGVVLILLFRSIIRYLLHSIRTKGTTCTSCTSCPIIEKCDKGFIKSEMLDFYKKSLE